MSRLFGFWSLALVLLALSGVNDAVPSDTIVPCTDVDYPAGAICLNVSVPENHLDPKNLNKVSVHMVGYDATVAVAAGEWVSVILSEGCQINNPRFRAQWGNSTRLNDISSVFVDPRGSGHSARVMCPDDLTGQNMVPSVACGDFARETKVNEFYTLEQLAYDLQLNILPAVDTIYPGAFVHLVAGDLFGNAWIQAWQKHFPLNNVAKAPIQFILFNSPPALQTYDFFQALVENPDSNVRTVLSQCSSIASCSKMFGGADLNQLLNEVMRSARQDELSCNKAISAAWTPAMGPVATPIFRFYSELFGMLLKSPVDAFADWNGKLPSLIPGVLYRIQRCNAHDVTVLTELYKSLKTYAEEIKTPNPKGIVVDWARCYVSPILRWNLVFNDLLKGVPPSTDTLIGSENDNTVFPTREYVTEVRELYEHWPINARPADKWDAYAKGNIAFTFAVGAVNPLVRPQMTMFAAGADYSMERVAPIPTSTTITKFGKAMIFPPVMIPTGNHLSLYSSPEFNGGFGFSCSFSLLWTFNTNVSLPYCVAEYGVMTQFDFIGASPLTKEMRNQFLKSTTDPFQSTGVIALPLTYPPQKIEFQTTTPLPPGETPDPPTTPLPPNATYAPPTPRPELSNSNSGSYSYHETITGDGTIHVHISVVGLVFLIIGGLVFIVLLVVCVAKVVQRRMNDPAKRDFYQEVYGGGANATVINQPQQENIYRNV